jgi:hypothetical protein
MTYGFVLVIKTDSVLCELKNFGSMYNLDKYRSSKGVTKLTRRGCSFVCDRKVLI